jgi:branched-chain amino acid transport system ATP-binding protein
VLEVKDIHTYYGSSYILQGVSLTVSKEEVACLLGRNGAGKSTTLKTIMGIVSPREGMILFKGEEIRGLKPFQIAWKGVGYVSEDRRIYPDFSVRENLEIVPHRKDEGMQWGLRESFTLFPQLKLIERRLGKQLSGGEQQMLTIARTLMGNPELVLLDEPSQGLAPIMVTTLIEAIKKMRSLGITLLMSEQNIHLAIKVASRVYILDNGRVVFESSIDDFVKNEAIARKYLLV